MTTTATATSPELDLVARPTLQESTPPEQSTPTPTGAARRVASTLLYVILVPVICLVLLVSVVSILSPNGRNQVAGHPVFAMLSGSMSPAIRTGDLVIDSAVSPAQARRLQVGQIISFEDSPGSPTIVSHRIVQVLHEGSSVSYVTKGDANNVADRTPRPSSSVVGVVSGVIPRGGYILRALQRPVVLVLFLVATILWFVAVPLFRYALGPDDPADADADVLPSSDVRPSVIAPGSPVRTPADSRRTGGGLE